MKHFIVFFLIILPFYAFGQDDDIEIDKISGDVVTLPPVVVESGRIDKKPKRTIMSDTISSAVGTGGDPLRVLDKLPSVGVLNDFVGILSVRGGGPEDNIYYFDRLPLGYPFHLYGIVSTMNAEVINNIDVYPGGYGVEFGSNSQAVIDIHSRSRTDRSVGGKLNLNPVYSQGFFEGSIGNRGYWYVFGRRSYMGPLFELLHVLLEIENDLVTEVPRFWSYQGKFVYQLTKTHRLVVNALGANDVGELNFTSDEVSESELRGPLSLENPFDSQGIHFYSEKIDTFKSVLSLSRSFSRSNLAYGDGYLYRDSESVFSLRGDVQYWVKFPKTLLESGFDLSILPSNLVSVGARPLEEGDWDFDFRLKQDGEKIYTDISQNIHRIEGYLQATQDLFSAFYTDIYATLGIRAAYYNLTDNLSVQPRGLLGVTIGPEKPDTVGFSLLPVDLRFMYGNYVQSPRFYQLVLGRDNFDISPSHATHYVLALEKNLTAETRVEVAGYYKDLRDMITYNLTHRRYENQRTGSVRGIEVSLEHDFGDAFRGWLAYSFTLSKRQDSTKDKEREFMFGTPNVLSVGLNYKIEQFEFGATWQYKSGVLYATLEDRERYTNPFTKNQTWIPVYGEIVRSSPYHRLDLRLHYSIRSIFGLKGGLTLELWNAYNRTNILQVRYNANYTKEVPVAQLPLVPFLAINLEF
ncbi:TonB-dependent receptor plug domain-containing protein [Candidatus Poribacteria bacterium]|nr:TonB-dependent receptor plug domain-containing protein [Candidatus Poribacteria bacterium]